MYFGSRQCYFRYPVSTVMIQAPRFVITIPGPSLCCQNQPLKIQHFNPCAFDGFSRRLGPLSATTSSGSRFSSFNSQGALPCRPFNYRRYWIQMNIHGIRNCWEKPRFMSGPPWKLVKICCMFWVSQRVLWSLKVCIQIWHQINVVFQYRGGWPMVLQILVASKSHEPQPVLPNGLGRWELQSSKIQSATGSPVPLLNSRSRLALYIPVYNEAQLTSLFSFMSSQSVTRASMKFIYF